MLCRLEPVQERQETGMFVLHYLSLQLAGIEVPDLLLYQILSEACLFIMRRLAVEFLTVRDFHRGKWELPRVIFSKGIKKKNQPLYGYGTGSISHAHWTAIIWVGHKHQCSKSKAGSVSARALASGEGQYANVSTGGIPPAPHASKAQTAAEPRRETQQPISSSSRHRTVCLSSELQDNFHSHLHLLYLFKKAKQIPHSQTISIRDDTFY